MIQSNNTAPEFPNEQHIRNVGGFFTILESVPTYTPRKFAEAIVLVRSGGSTRAYFYDSGWRYATLT